MIIEVTKKGGIILVKKDEVAVVGRGLLTSEFVDEGTARERLPPASAVKKSELERRIARLSTFVPPAQQPSSMEPPPVSSFHPRLRKRTGL